MRVAPLILLAAAASCLSGCLFTRLVTVPMRVTGAVLTIVPVAGDAAHGAIDKAAKGVDKLPF